MFQKDFVLRMVERLGLVLSKLLGLKQQGEYSQVLDLIHKSFEEDVKININRIADLDVESFEDEMALNDTDPEKLNFIAELLFEEAEVYDIQGEVEKCVDRRMKVLLILNAYLKSPNPKISIHLYHRIDGIIEYLKLFNLPFVVNKICFEYFYTQKKFAKAEDILFNMISNSDHLNEVHEMGINFYEDLLKLDNKLLEKGDLTKEEVDYGYKEFHKEVGKEIAINQK